MVEIQGSDNIFGLETGKMIERGKGVGGRNKEKSTYHTLWMPAVLRTQHMFVHLSAGKGGNCQHDEGERTSWRVKYSSVDDSRERNGEKEKRTETLHEALPAGRHLSSDRPPWPYGLPCDPYFTISLDESRSG